ncbi:uncharacterized protein FPRO_04466 [Fusarium proliferatum ET1]|uniref:Secreted protein n=1 Tax=Fusarium proliferatum (strain ET1) TaxID=1227346 RepID=A0A1L7VFY9_FUSPR|nr:uncharacterized protein FPRO_04466 [Fusarium proliferatum ET1]CVK93168.1 uncharacterized protein FPRN_04335 [Fusarium proliferatum]CZR39569.1 uncharacterized protein FPRO_04466 [Fusarium proliferatum ET1]
MACLVKGANSSLPIDYQLLLFILTLGAGSARPRPPVTSSETFHWPHASDQRTSDSGNKQCRPSERVKAGLLQAYVN